MRTTDPQRRARTGGRALIPRPVTEINSEEGIYTNQKGNLHQPADTGETKPLDAEEIRCGRGDLETPGRITQGF